MASVQVEAPSFVADAEAAVPVARATVIAEIGVNHDGRLEQALQLVRAAREAGADAVKFQTFRAERIASPHAPRAAYQERGGDRGGGQLDLLRRLELGAEDFAIIRDWCSDHGIEFLSTPFDAESVEVLDRLAVARFKVGSGDLDNVPLLEEIGRRRRPVILSTGMATDDEIELALATLDGAGAPEVTLLHCISRYPAPAQSLQLLRIPALRRLFGRPVGYSDHSIGVEAALAARALGATVIEKHFTLDRHAPGPDHAASADPEGFMDVVTRLRRLEVMLGTGERTFDEEELAIRGVARKSVVAVRTIRPGDRLDESNVAILRPGTGIAPRHWRDVLGKVATRQIPEGEPVEWSAIE